MGKNIHERASQMKCFNLAEVLLGCAIRSGLDSIDSRPQIYIYVVEESLHLFCAYHFGGCRACSANGRCRLWFENIVDAVDRMAYYELIGLHATESPPGELMCWTVPAKNGVFVEGLSF